MELAVERQHTAWQHATTMGFGLITGDGAWKQA
jgi:hypothetical protein